MRYSRLHRRSRAALTLVEVLIATTLTLMLMLALAQGFKALSDSVTEGRTKLGLSDQLRGISSILRADLERCTASSKVLPTYPGPGYFKYYDGPLWDSTALQANFSATAPLVGSRWGDIDDVLMFTARANPGEVFRGTIPQALMIISQLNHFAKEGRASSDSIASNFISSVNGAVNNGSAWTTEVSIESDIAEIVWFMMPMREGNRLPAASSGGYISPVATSIVIDEVQVDGMPDRLALCRRELPIRPDIDLNPVNPDSTYQGIITSLLNHGNAPTISVSAGNPGSFRTAMHQFYQRCDLSLKPHRWEAIGTGFMLSVKSNSLDDLQRPENRFAHFTYPVSTAAGIPVASATLPLLALTDENAGTGGYLAATNGLYSITGLTPTQVSNRGFMLPCFMRSRVDGTPMLTEVVATNVIGFDAKVFDATAMQLGHPGPDGGAGDAFSANSNAEFGVAGLSGSDDLAVSPSDPGYAAILGSASTNNMPMVLSQGAFVDMGWGWRLHTNPAVSTLGMDARATLKDYFLGHASGIYEIGTSVVADPAIKAGGSYYNLSNQLMIYQPVYDTYTDYYDRDGERLDINANGERFYRGGLRRFNITVAEGFPDDYFDGIRNQQEFADSVPPAPFDIPAVKVTIRVQDVTAGVLQQMTVIESFGN